MQSETLSILGQALHICLRGKKKCFSQSWTVTDCTSLDGFKLHCFCPDRLVMASTLFSNEHDWQNMKFAFHEFVVFSFPIFIKCFHLAKMPCACESYILQVFGLKDWGVWRNTAPVSVLLKKNSYASSWGKKNFFYFAVILKYGIRPTNSVHNLLVIFHWIICSIILINKKFALVKQKM